MPKVKVNGLNMNYDKRGSGEPLILIPFLTADHSCYAFQIPVYSKYFTCFSIDPRGGGETEKPQGFYSTDILADDIAGFMQVLGIEKAHILGTSLGAATALKFATKYPDKVKSLSTHSGWSKTDYFIKLLVNGWIEIANFKESVSDTVISFIFPFCLSPELFVKNPDYIKSLSDFVKSRPEQPIEAFLSQCFAVLSHDCELELGNIKAPTLLTFGEIDLITSISRFGTLMKNRIKNSEILVFGGCAHTPMYEKTEDFNQKTMNFLKRYSG